MAISVQLSKEEAQLIIKICSIEWNKHVRTSTGVRQLLATKSSATLLFISNY
ncbi:MAG: hypothetical protein PHR10_00175 [Sphaerochaetaceae bacterium]|jgi:hypothetical protein|nr:hypothetical protein [Sphaerochaetaceae bacterium]